MNDRIEKLALQAVGGWPSYDAEGEKKMSETEYKKFAELIVRECASYAFSDDQDHRAMLTHFGVE